MGGYYALLGRGPSLIDIAQASGWTKQQRDARALQREDRAYLAEQRNAALAHQRQSDELALKKQTATEQATTDTAVANKQRYFANLYANNPQDRERIDAAARAQGIQIDQPASVSLPGGETIQAGNLDAPPRDSGELAMDLQGRATGVLGAPKPGTQHDPRSSFAQQLIDQGVPQGSPQFNSAMQRYNTAEIARMERQPKGMTINIGGKTLPTNTVEGMADASSAQTAVDRLLSSYNKNVPSAGALDQFGARIAAKVPNTDTSIYQSEADITTQTVGTYLEGGVLKEADFARYKKMMPQPGDAPETAARKAENLKMAIHMRAQERAKQLGGAGYRVPSTQQQHPPTDAEIDAEIQAIQGGQ